MNRPAQTRAYRERHAEQLKLRHAKWRAENRDQLLKGKKEAYSRLITSLEGRVRHMYGVIKTRARQRGQPCSITLDELTHMVREATVCPVLGMPLSPAESRATDNSPSFDCFHPELGYVPGNVFVISHRANLLKNNATAEELRAVVTWMEATTVVIDANKE